MAQKQAGPLIRRLISAVGVEVLLALAVGWAVIGLPRLTDNALDVLIAVGVAGLLLLLPAVELLQRQRLIVVVGLPVFRRATRRPSVRVVRVVAGGALLLVVALINLGGHGLALVLIAVTDLALLVLVAELLLRLRRRPRDRGLLTAALTSYRPEFVVYTARRNDASYQLEMWLPELAKLGRPYVLVVRHEEAISYARLVTSAPVICCPSGADLDAVIVPSLRAAFYVNGIAENANFVSYRQLRHVYLGHGDSDKELSVHPMHAMFDRIFVAGQAAIDRYGPAGVQIEVGKFVIVGRPQLAGLQGPGRGSPDRPHPESGATPRVLFAPTWRGYNAKTMLSSLPVGPAIVEALIGAGAAVTFRPHPFSWLGTEREHIDAVDALLRADRESSGRPHRLAVENRAVELTTNFDDSDALVSDVGSVLVDYFATEKPYAAVLPAGTDPAEARAQFPSLTAAYLIDRSGQDSGWLQDLLVTDPLSGRRTEVCRLYLGPRPRDDRPFLAAVGELLDHSDGCGPSPAGASPTGQDSTGQDSTGQDSTGQGGQDPVGAAAEAEFGGETGEDARVRGLGR